MTRAPLDIQREIEELDRTMTRWMQDQGEAIWNELHQRRADLCDERAIAVEVRETLRKQRFYDRIGR